MKVMVSQCNIRAMEKPGDIGKRIRRLRAQILGIKSQAEFAAALGNVTRGAVGNWERGQGIKQENLRRIADVFDVSYEWLVMGRGEPRNSSVTTPLTKSHNVGMVPVRGVVEAGNWQDVDPWGADDMPEYVPSSGDYPLEWQFAFVVHGESLNLSARDGDRLVCVDLIKSGISIADGDLVVVERKRFGGQMVERTAKRVRQTLRGIELWPESSHPAHQDPIAYELSDDPEHNHVEVIGKVIWILRQP